MAPKYKIGDKVKTIIPFEIRADGGIFEVRPGATGDVTMVMSSGSYQVTIPVSRSLDHISLTVRIRAAEVDLERIG
jgi:hypothetical protein